MSNWVTVGASITQEEKEQLIRCVEEYSKEKNTDISLNKFLRMMIKHYIKKHS